MPLKTLVLNHISSQYPKWIHKGEVGRLAVNDWGYENENMGRRCRELVKEGRLERKLEKGSVWYRWIAPKKEQKVEATPTSLFN